MQKIKYVIVIFFISHLSFLISDKAFATHSVSPGSSSMEVTYPGLLPDHPLYFLKVAKDNVVGFFKGEPIDRASYSLLQTEKHLGASHLLITEKKNQELGLLSLENAQSSLEEAIKYTEAAKKEGKSTHDLCQKLKQTAKKHVELYALLEQQHKKENAAKIVDGKTRAEDLATTVYALRP